MKKLAFIALFVCFLRADSFDCAVFIDKELFYLAPELRVDFSSDKAAYDAARIALGIIIERCEVANSTGEVVTREMVLQVFSRKWGYFYGLLGGGK